MSEKERVALGSIGASAALTIGKAVVGFSTGSLAILAYRRSPRRHCCSCSRA
jgi:divalent metal cation (Fe/Co/Zn/Cd) transporter